MSRFHDSATDDNLTSGGQPSAECPICKKEMSPAALPNHIAEHGEKDE